VSTNEQESACQSFIVKIWSEGADREGKNLRWRGHVTHVPSGDRHYVNGFSEISNTIEAYLKNAGTTVAAKSWARSWLNWLRQWF
jgi:hypothetical protein